MQLIIAMNLKLLTARAGDSPRWMSCQVCSIIHDPPQFLWAGRLFFDDEITLAGSYYWTSTPDPGNPDFALLVQLYTGVVQNQPKEVTLEIKAVRGGK